MSAPTRVLGPVTAPGWSLPRYLEQLPAGVEDVWLAAEALPGLGLSPVEWPAEYGPFFDREIDGRRVRVHVPAWDLKSPWRACRSAAELRAALAAFERAVGVGWRVSGAVTSDRLLVAIREAQGQRKPWLVASDQPPDEVALSEQDAHFLSERPVMSAARWLHGYDLNAAYLAAAASVECGVGELTHLDAPGIDRAHRLPGYWRIAGEEVFRTSPTIVYELERGRRLTLAEGWCWPRHGRHLRYWYERLRDGRRQLLEPGGPPLEALKAVYRAGIGRLASRRRLNLRSPLYQPGWRHAVVATSRVNLYRRLRKVSERAVLVWVDAAYFATDTADPAEFAAAIGLPLGSDLGQFKILGSCELDRTVNASVSPDKHPNWIVLRDALGSGRAELAHLAARGGGIR